MTAIVQYFAAVLTSLSLWINSFKSVTIQTKAFLSHSSGGLFAGFTIFALISTCGF